MLKQNKLLSLIVAVSVILGLGVSLPVNAEDSRVVLADFTTPAESTDMPMYNPEARNDADKIIKDTEICYGVAQQSGRWAVTGSNSNLMYISVSDEIRNNAANCDTFVIRFFSEKPNDKFTVLFGKSEEGVFGSGNYYNYNLTVTKAGWQEEEIPVSDIEARCPISEFRSFKIHKGGWEATNGNFNKENTIYFDSMWFKNSKLEFLDFTTPAQADMPMHDANSNARGKIYVDTTIRYGNAKQSGKWIVTSGVGLLKPYNLPSSFDLGAAASFDNFVIRVYSTEADDRFNVLFYTGEGGTGSYSQTAVTTRAGWQELIIPVSEIKEKLAKKGCTFEDIKSFKLDKGNWSVTPNYNSVLYFDTMWFENESDFDPTFTYVSSEYDNKSDVGVYDTITMDFNERLSSTVACDAVTIYRGETEVTEFLAWTEGKRLYIKTNEAMHFESQYWITVTESLFSSRGYTLNAGKTISFTTAAPYLAVDAVRLTDESGADVEEPPAAGETIRICANAINGSDNDRSFVAIIAMYDSEARLLAMSEFSPVTAIANMAVPSEISNSCVVAEGTTAIRGFVWDASDTITPLCKSAEIKQ